MNKRKSDDAAEVGRTEIKAGDEVRYVVPDRIEEVDAKVIEARPGSRVDLAFRIDGTLKVAAEAAHGPGQAGCWSFPGELPAPPPVPEAGGRPIVPGATVAVMGRDVGALESFYMAPGHIVAIDGESLVVEVRREGHGPYSKRLAIASYRGTRFRAGGWAWADEAAGITVPGPRRFGFAEQRIVCPITGQRIRRADSVPVGVGARTGGLSFFEADALLSAEGASLLRRLLAGEPVELPRASS